MRQKHRSRWDRVQGHIGSNFGTGLLVIVPLAVTFLVIQFVYVFIETKTQPMLTHMPGQFIPGLGVFGVLVGLYVVGVLANRVIGRRFVNLGHQFIERVPLIRPIYRTTRQALEVLNSPAHRPKSRVVLLDFPRPGVRALGLITAHLTGPNQEHMVAVYIPTVPNPTSGQLAIIAIGDVTYLDLPMEEAMKIVISGGVLMQQDLMQNTSSN